MSFIISSSHLFFVHASGRVNVGFHLYTFFTILSSYIWCKWPNQFNLCAFMWFTKFLCLINSSNSSCVLVLHVPQKNNYIILNLGVRNTGVFSNMKLIILATSHSCHLTAMLEERPRDVYGSFLTSCYSGVNWLHVALFVNKMNLFTNEQAVSTQSINWPQFQISSLLTQSLPNLCNASGRHHNLTRNLRRSGFSTGQWSFGTSSTTTSHPRRPDRCGIECGVLM
jgi:hypothetical protein